MQTVQDFAGSTDMWSTSVGGHLMKVVNLTGFTVSDCCQWNRQLSDRSIGSSQFTITVATNKQILHLVMFKKQQT